MRYLTVFAFSVALLVPSTSYHAPAADLSARSEPSPPTLALPTGERLLALTTSTRAEAEPAAVTPAAPDRDPRRPVLSALHAVTGVVQTYDGMLTMRVLDAGGRETNPLMKPAIGNETVMLSVKVAAAVATVIGTELLWRDNHRLAAIVSSVVANSAMAMIARHNAQVLARLEGR